MGAMTLGAIKSSSLFMPASFLSAFMRQADDAPSRELVLPVTMVPSGSSMLTAGAPVSAALAMAAATTGRSAEEMPSEFMMSSILRTSSGEPRP